MKKKSYFIPISVVVGLIIIGIMMLTHKKETIYLDYKQSIDARIENLMQHLTLEEKISLCHANSKFTIAGIERLGIPEMTMSDGPNGVREDGLRDEWGSAGRTDDSSTALPSQVSLACTWNTDLAYRHGKVLGAEARFRDKDIILAPGINILRTPRCGRNYEYMSEDPFLISKMVVQHIKGIQSEGTAACVKHYLANNQEYERNIVNVEMSERTLREIYLPGFKAAVEEGDVLCVMGAYNKFRGHHCCHNHYLINKILKGEMNFKGLFMSDWDGCHNTSEAVNNGLDIEMGTEGGKKYNEYYLANSFLLGIKEGKYSEEILDEKVKRILYVMFKTRMAGDRPKGEFNTPAHQKHCLSVAEEGVVLLKNDNHILPLDKDKIKSIAVIGRNATQKQAEGGGSGTIKALYEISPLLGLTKKVGGKVKINYAEGFTIADTANRSLLIKEAVAAARKSEVAIIFAGLSHVWNFKKEGSNGWDCEGFDNNSWELPWQQDELIQAVVKANPKTIVFLISGSAYSINNWVHRVPGVLYSSYAGMEAGNAFANILFGDANPSGKLSFTYPALLSDSPAHAQSKKEYPGVNHTVTYSEGIFVGYRWFERKGITPEFPFGYGLSYTTFSIDSLTWSNNKMKQNDTVKVSVVVKNTGLCRGSEVVQLYIHDEKASVVRPSKELKGFKKIFLEPGESKVIEFIIDQQSLSFWSVKEKRFIAEPGTFQILIGNSSTNISLKGSMELL